MDFSKFDEVIGLLEDNKEKIQENDFMKIYEGIQNFYETIEKLNKTIKELNEKVGCQCEPDIGLCPDPNKYSKCKNFVKYKKDIPVFSFYINGRPTELQLVLEDKISKDLAVHLIKNLLISFQMAPHPSYPPLEKSFCNGLTLHTSFSYKNLVSISRYTDKIIMCEPNINSLLNGLEKAIKIIRSNSVNNINPKLLNDNWDKPLNKCFNFFISQS